MDYDVLEVIGLPVLEEREVHPGVLVEVPGGETLRKEPGDTVSVDELHKAGQTEEDIQSLIDHEAIAPKGARRTVEQEEE